MYAILDIGSNSFHLVIAEHTNDPDGEGRVSLKKTLNRKVQLAEGISASSKLSKAAVGRGLSALKDCQTELLQYPVTRFCVVGTNALRTAKNAGKFIRSANYLGFPINVISGDQEAWYIYKGIQAFLPESGNVRLFIDIGGGSTEFAMGHEHNPILVNSLPLGCVACRDEQADENITAKSLARIKKMTHDCLDQKLSPGFYDMDFREVYASSGTAKMLGQVLKANGLTNGSITLGALHELEQMVIDLGSVFKLNQLDGLKSSRRNVFTSGLGIMLAIMDHLGIEHIDYCDFALREGVLLSMIEEQGDFPLYTVEGQLACLLSHET
jgi:exopolyphosphatase/guanosine-5'-triphosphate,3'-diphosphate pyrophosphatase